jgi:Putative 2OG-Fe(II) oxygenase
VIPHSIFPTLIGEWYYERHFSFKETFFKHILNHMTPTGATGEASGHVNVHHEPDFANFFTMVTFQAKEYVSQLRVDPDLFDFNLIKTWLTISDKWSVPVHDHSDAHLAFVYYVNVPDKAPTTPIYFMNTAKPNDLINNMFHIQGNNAVLVKEWNHYNSLTWNWNPFEGMMLMFPAKLRHYTDTGFPGARDNPTTNIDELRSRRISIAGDFLLTYKKKEGISFGIQPTSNWKLFA